MQRIAVEQWTAEPSSPQGLLQPFSVPAASDSTSAKRHAGELSGQPCLPPLVGDSIEYDASKRRHWTAPSALLIAIIEGFVHSRHALYSYPWLIATATGDDDKVAPRTLDRL